MNRICLRGCFSEVSAVTGLSKQLRHELIKFMEAARAHPKLRVGILPHRAESVVRFMVARIGGASSDSFA